MAKAKTFFEQVPVALALQIAAQQDGSGLSGPVLCGICATPVELESCKINEFGQAVHGKCYTSAIAGGAESKRAAPIRPKVHERSKATNR